MARRAEPDPKIFEIACRELGGLAAGDCWFVGDHPENDVRGAAAFGMTAVWITRGVDGHAWPADAPKPAHWISALSELLPLLGLVALPEVV
jgi:putative hydrolase of the HAD superfamily